MCPWTVRQSRSGEPHMKQCRFPWRGVVHHCCWECSKREFLERRSCYVLARFATVETATFGVTRLQPRMISSCLPFGVLSYCEAEEKAAALAVVEKTVVVADMGSEAAGASTRATAAAADLVVLVVAMIGGCDVVGGAVSGDAQLVEKGGGLPLPGCLGCTECHMALAGYA